MTELGSNHISEFGEMCFLWGKKEIILIMEKHYHHLATERQYTRHEPI